MGWSTELFCNISFNRETFDTKEQVKEAIEEVENRIKRNENKIRDLIVCQNPSILMDKDSEVSVYDYLISTYRDTMDELQEDYIQCHKLYLLLDRWDNCHNKEGLAKKVPDEIGYDTSYIWGDFIKTEK